MTTIYLQISVNHLYRYTTTELTSYDASILSRMYCQNPYSIMKIKVSSIQTFFNLLTQHFSLIFTIIYHYFENKY